MPAGFVKTRLVKRETGVIPVRSRHCDKGVQILFPHGKPLVHGTGKAESVVLFRGLSDKKPDFH